MNSNENLKNRNQKGLLPRVLLVGPLPKPPLLGGVETGVDLLLNSQLARDARMTFFNTFRKEDVTRPLYEKLAYQLFACIRFALMLARVRPTVVHIKTSSGINFYQNYVFALIARLSGKKVLLQLHSGGFPQFFDDAGRLEKRLIRSALGVPHGLIVLSEGWRQYFQRIFDAKSVGIVCNALSTDVYAQVKPDRGHFGIPIDCTALLFMGTRSCSLDFDKGLKELVRAVVKVREKHSELVFVIAGKNSCRKLLFESFGEDGEGWIDLGVITPEFKPMLYRSVDLFALPSYYENMPNTLLEAMAAGVPAIATPVGAIPEMIQDGSTGFLIPVRDVELLIDRIERLVSSRTLRQVLGKRAREVAVKRYDLKVLERQLGYEYRRVVSRC